LRNLDRNERKTEEVSSLLFLVSNKIDDSPENVEPAVPTVIFPFAATIASKKGKNNLPNFTPSNSFSNLSISPTLSTTTPSFLSGSG
jgi:hypothetical protein